MSWFQLDPENVCSRVKLSGKPAHIPSLAESIIVSVAGFTLVSVAGFLPWVFGGPWFYKHTGEGGLYLTCLAVFLLLSGLALHWLIIGPGSLPRFYALFSLAFLIYAVGWIGCWMLLRRYLGDHSAGLLGLFVGTAAMALVLAGAFQARQSALPVFAALFILNSLGYFGGGVIEQVVAHDPAKITVARLLWGVCYGAGFGAGLGCAFYSCQAGIRARLARDASTS